MVAGVLLLGIVKMNIHLRVQHALGEVLLQLGNQPIIAQQVSAVLLSLQKLVD